MRNKKLMTVISGICLLLLVVQVIGTSGVVLPGTVNYTIRGRVVNRDGDALPGVTVSLVLGGTTRDTDVTASDGTYSVRYSVILPEEIDPFPLTFTVKFEMNGYSTQITKTVNPNSLVTADVTYPFDFLDNGNFETGSLAHWTTDYASVTSASSYVHTGSYGCILARQGWIGYPIKFLTWNPAYIQQDVWIPSENTGISFYHRNPISGSITITVRYDDGTWGFRAVSETSLTSWLYYSTSLSWGSKIITRITISFTKMSVLNAPAIDDIQVGRL
ncbi:MAG: hypothetical protein ACFFD4_11880 [Candidatus Odinarchaeota archaeon]